VTSPKDDWFIEGRWYSPTVASDPDGLAVELDDVGPAPGRGVVMDAHRHFTTGEYTFAYYAKERLPLEVVERFVGEARRWLPDDVAT
jgi:hypothetical protein